MKRERDHSRDREKLASVDISGGYVCVWVWVSREETCLTSTQHFKYLLLHTLTRSQRYSYSTSSLSLTVFVAYSALSCLPLFTTLFFFSLSFLSSFFLFWFIFWGGIFLFICTFLFIDLGFWFILLCVEYKW